MIQGRRIAKENAVENPVFWEIRDVLDDAGFKYWIEDKGALNFFQFY